MCKDPGECSHVEGSVPGDWGLHLHLCPLQGAEEASRGKQLYHSPFVWGSGTKCL